MAPDEAADLLAEFSKERSEDLLGLMEGEEAEDVRSLLSYPEDSAGGIMNTEYIIIPPDLTAEEAIKYLRENASEAETIFYVYVTDPDEHLLGVISLRTLIMADPQARISSFMVKRIISVMPNEEQNEVAQLVAKYDLLAIPVVDEENHILGIVTSDDALDKIIPTTWKKRMPRIYR
jgi:magnesium transporter